MEQQFNEVLKVVCDRLGYASLRPEQVEALRCIIENKNVLVNLPTGYGKSEVYALAPVILDEVQPILYIHVY